MKATFLFAMLSLPVSLLAARPVVETERIMKDKAYQGVWLEIHQRLLRNL